MGAVVVVDEAVEDLVVVPHVVEVAVEVPLGEEVEVEQTVSRLVLEVLGPIRRRHLTIKTYEFQPLSSRAFVYLDSIETLKFYGVHMPLEAEVYKEPA